MISTVEMFLEMLLISCQRFVFRRKPLPKKGSVHHNTGLFEMFVGGLTTCHTQYTLIEVYVFFFIYLIEQHYKFLLHTL